MKLAAMEAPVQGQLWRSEYCDYMTRHLFGRAVKFATTYCATYDTGSVPAIESSTTCTVLSRQQLLYTGLQA